jgi:hypothetical protein
MANTTTPAKMRDIPLVFMGPLFLHAANPSGRNPWNGLPQQELPMRDAEVAYQRCFFVSNDHARSEIIEILFQNGTAPVPCLLELIR